MDLRVSFVIGQALKMGIEIIFLAILCRDKMQNIYNKVTKENIKPTIATVHVFGTYLHNVDIINFTNYLGHYLGNIKYSIHTKYFI